MSAAQMSRSRFRVVVPPRGTPGTSVFSGESPDTELVAVSKPVAASIANVTISAVISHKRYRNLLSAETTKWRGPAPGLVNWSAGVFEASLPARASNVNMKTASLPSVGT